MKHARLDSYLETQDLSSVWFARPEGFAWLTGGDNRLVRDRGVGVAAAGYDGEAVTVLAPNNEAARLRAEELSEAASVTTYPWHERDLEAAIAAVAGEPAAADVPIPGFAAVDASAIRQPLTESDVEAYRDVGERTASAVEAVCGQLESGDTEGEVASALSIALSVRGLDASVVLVGAGERAQRFRHPTPGETQLGAYALVSVTAHDDGLFASCTRTVAFDAPEWLPERHRAAARVEATALAATREVAQADGASAPAGRESAGAGADSADTGPDPGGTGTEPAAAGGATKGGTAADVFEAIQDAYDAVGWPEEWREHHQGGAAGYAGREWIATPTSTERVYAPQGYAWNPTIQGAKSEGTVLVDDGFERLTATGDWPTIAVDAVGFDASLERPAVREL